MVAEKLPAKKQAKKFLSPFELYQMESHTEAEPLVPRTDLEALFCINLYKTNVAQYF